jgi:hypothetical protein
LAPRFDQQAARRFVTPARGGHQCRVARGVLHVEIRVPLQQCRHRTGMAACRREQQRRVALSSAVIDGDSRGEQAPDDAGMAARRGGVQCRDAGGVGRRSPGAGVQQRFDEIDIAMAACIPQRIALTLVRGADVRATLQQQLRHRGLAGLCRREQGSAPGCVHDVVTRSGIEQGLDVLGSPGAHREQQRPVLAAAARVGRHAGGQQFAQQCGVGVGGVAGQQRAGRRGPGRADPRPGSAAGAARRARRHRRRGAAAHRPAETSGRDPRRRRAAAAP